MKKENAKKKEMITEEEVAKFQKMLSRIGSHKTKGFIYMGEIDSKEAAKGIVFTHEVSKLNFAMNLINNLYKTKLEKLLFATDLVSSLKEREEDDK